MKPSQTTNDPGNREDAEQYARSLLLSPTDQQHVARCLAEFPMECRSRGMFFDGVLESVRQRKGEARAKEIVKQAGISYRIQNFGQYPHRDFYKVYYAAAKALHPELPMGQGMERIAEAFYPLMFAQSLAGRTMALLMGKDPATVLSRLVDAYGIAATWNEHTFERGNAGTHTWRCRVEPCEFYPHTFQGICRGMVESILGVDPRVRVVSAQKRTGEHRYVFEIS